MNTSICLRCLSSLPHRAETSLTRSAAQRIAAFSTSASLSVNPPKKKTSASAKPATRSGRTLVLKKNARASTSRPPASGERKALRKKITLSNPNALEVPGLQILNLEHLALNDESPVLTPFHSHVLGLADETVNALKELESFKHTQRWNLFKRPATLIRDETIQSARQIARAEASGSSEVVREIVFGERGSGKSILLLQAQAMALLKGWVVIHVPDGNEVTNGQTAFQPLRTESGMQYTQPQYMARLLNNISRANNSVLQELKLSRQHELPIPIQPNISLARLAELGARDADLAWPIWNALWAELVTPSRDEQGLQRPPVFISVDGLDHMMRESKYVDSNSKIIHAFDMTLVAHFVKLLTGQEQLPNGGMVMGVVSQSNRAATPTLDYCLDRLHARKLLNASKSSASTLQTPKTWDATTTTTTNSVLSRWDPYVPKDERVDAMMKHITDTVKVQGISKTEARGLMEYYASSGMLRGSITDTIVSDRWSLAGSGILGELERGTVGSPL